MNTHSRLAILGVAFVLFVSGCSSTPTSTATLAPIATPPTRPIGIALELGSAGPTNLSEGAYTLAPDWSMKPFDTWRIDVRASFSQTDGTDSGAIATYVGLATNDGEVLFAIGADGGQLSARFPRLSDFMSTSSGAYDLNVSYDMTLSGCTEPNGAFGVSYEFKRAGVSMANGAFGSNGRSDSSFTIDGAVPSLKTIVSGDSLTRLVIDGSARGVRFDSIEVSRVSTDAKCPL